MSTLGQEDLMIIPTIIKTVEKPFDSESGGDCIIRTADKVDFHVHQHILALVSSVFADMFSMPQPSVTSGTQSPPPVLDVAEDSLVIDALLRSIYPLTKPVVDSLDLAFSLVLVAEKYFISPELLPLRPLLGSDQTLSTAPITAYAIAWRLGFKEEASKASSYTHAADLSDKDIKRQLLEGSGGLEALVALHELRGKRAARLSDVAAAMPIFYLICSDCNAASLLVEQHVRNLSAGLKDALNHPPQTVPQDFRTFWKIHEILARECQDCANQSSSNSFTPTQVNHFWDLVRAYPSTIEWPERA